MDRDPKKAELAVQEASMLEQIAEASDSPTAGTTEPAQPATNQGLVGECVDHRHPTLVGRAKVKWRSSSGTECEKWLPCLMTVTVRRGDRVLMLQPGNWPEPLVVGVVDGFKSRPETDYEGPTIELANDEAVRVVSSSGERLVDIHESEQGPVVRLLSQDVDLELPGRLRLNARSIELKATEGEVRVEASDDVIVKGETIELN